MHNHRAPSLSLLLTCAATIAGCTSQATSKDLLDRPPAPFVVLVEAERPPQSTAPLAFAAEGAQMQRWLVQDLRALDASSRIVTREELAGAQPDLTVRLQPTSAIEFEHVGTANFFGAGGLWLVTWIGGLLVPDSRYEIRMGRDGALCSFAQNESRSFQRPLRGGEVDVAFLERNSFLSLSTAQSLILPPFWTSDELASTNEALSRSTMRLAAEQIARMLKTGGIENESELEFQVAIRIQSPRNGDAPTTKMPLRLTATTPSPVTRASASVNGGPERELRREAGADSTDVSGDIDGLPTDRESLIRITVVADKVYTRTLRLTPQQPRA